jgi:hypothetical protein
MKTKENYIGSSEWIKEEAHKISLETQKMTLMYKIWTLINKITFFG